MLKKKENYLHGVLILMLFVCLTDKWLKYDDDRVTEVNNEEIKKLDGKGGGDWHIAYLCLYRTLNTV